MRAILSDLLILVFSCVVALAAAQKTVAQNAAVPKPSDFAIEWVEETITVIAKPRVEALTNPNSVATNTIRAYDSVGCGIPPHIRYVPVPLDSNQVYTFTVSQRKRTKPLPAFTATELRKVVLGNETIYDIEVCEVHKTKMAHTEVPIHYGLIPGSPEPLNAARRPALPHHREYKLGGCMVWAEAPKTGKVYVCNECKKNFDKWKEEDTKARNAAIREMMIRARRGEGGR